MQQWQNLGVKFIQVLPAIQLRNEKRQTFEGVMTVGEIGTDIRTWFGQTDQSIVVLRPDRFVAALAIPQTLNKISKQLFAKIHVK